MRNDGRIAAGVIGINASGVTLDVPNIGTILARTGMQAEGSGAEMLNTGFIAAGGLGMLTLADNTILRNLGTVAVEGRNGLAAIRRCGEPATALQPAAVRG